MKNLTKKILVIILISNLFTNIIEAQISSISIIPKPNKIEIFEGFFEINKKTTIFANDLTNDIALQIQKFFKTNNQFVLKIKDSNKIRKNSVRNRLRDFEKFQRNLTICSY